MSYGLKIPENLAWVASGWPGIREFIDSLPTRIADIESRWSIKAGEPYEPGGFTSYTARATATDGARCVLKIAYAWEPIRYEPDALRAWDGDGATRLLRDEPFTMLLERCEPGISLDTEDFDTADAIAVDLLRRLWREPPADIPWRRVVAADVAGRMPDKIAADYARADRPFDISHARFAQDFATQALAYSGPELLLHGDFHQSNVLHAEREPWLVIDPSPLVGDPTFDAAYLMTDRAGEILADGDPTQRMRDRLEFFSDQLELDLLALAGWTLTRCISVVLEALFDDAPWARERRELIPHIAQVIGY